MDASFIAQCMARLPRLTYFSHPEPSLEAFLSDFSEETGGAVNGGHRGDHAPTVRQGPGPQELQFLSSVNQSLGIRTMVDNGGAVLDVGRPRASGRSLSRINSSRLADRQPCATFRGHLSSHQPFFAGTSEIPALLPFQSKSPKLPASVVVSSAPHHGVHYNSLQTPKPAQLPVATNAFHTSRYQCGWRTTENRQCGEWIEGGIKEVWEHVRTSHGLKGFYSGSCQCKWGNCMETLKGSSMQRHLDKHLGTKYSCSDCGRVFSRDDTLRKHVKQKDCQDVEASTSEQMPETSGSEGQAVGAAVENIFPGGFALADTSFLGYFPSLGGT